MLTSSGNEAQIRDAFRVFDKDDKGFLTVRKNEEYEENDNANTIISKMSMRFPSIEPRHKKPEGGGHIQNNCSKNAENNKTFDFSGCDRILCR